jgi:plasmid stabilization system protein ParE
MNVRFTPEAEAQVNALDAWWRANRDARDLFARELAKTTALIAGSPKVGKIYMFLDDEPMRKIFMRKTRHHVYYTHDEAGAEIVIHSVWGTPKQHGPTF